MEEGSWKRKGNVEEISQEEEDEEERHLSLPGSGRDDKPGTRFRTQLLAQSRTYYHENKGIGDAGSTADFRMLWSAMVCLCLL